MNSSASPLKPASSPTSMGAEVRRVAHADLSRVVTNLRMDVTGARRTRLASHPKPAIKCLWRPQLPQTCGGCGGDSITNTKDAAAVNLRVYKSHWQEIVHDQFQESVFSSLCLGWQ